MTSLLVEIVACARSALACTYNPSRLIIQSVLRSLLTLLLYMLYLLDWQKPFKELMQGEKTLYMEKLCCKLKMRMQLPER